MTVVISTLTFLISLTVPFLFLVFFITSSLCQITNFLPQIASYNKTAIVASGLLGLGIHQFLYKDLNKIFNLHSVIFVLFLSWAALSVYLNHGNWEIYRIYFHSFAIYFFVSILLTDETKTQQFINIVIIISVVAAFYGIYCLKTNIV